MCVPGAMCCSTHRCATMRVSVRVSCFRVANRPRQWHDEQQQGHGRERTHAPGERSEGRHEREDVAIEVRAQRQQVGEVDEDERRQDQICTSAAGEGDHQSDSTHDERGAEPFPEPPDERDRRDVVVLEAEPAVPRESLHAKGLVPGLVAVHDDERARREKGCNGKDSGDRKPAPLLPAGDDQGDEQEDARVLEAHCEPDRDACELEPARTRAMQATLRHRGSTVRP